MFAVQNLTAAFAARPGARPAARGQLARGCVNNSNNNIQSNSNNRAAPKKPSSSSSPVSLVATRRVSSTAPLSRGATLRARANPSRDNPNFDPNDPMTWNAPSGGGNDADFMLDMGAPVDDLMQLDDAQLAQLLGAEGATVPVMLEDGGISPADDGDGAATSAQRVELPPATAAEAIDKGLALYRAGEYGEALAAFTGALDLPGTGPIRRRKAKVMPAGPSLGFEDADVSLNEQIAIHYNCACCHARLGDTQAGLVSLVRSMEAGYDDYDNVRDDADIAALRADARFEGIMGRFEPSGFVEGVFAMMQRGTTREQAKKGGAPRGGGGGDLIGGLFNAVKSKMDK